MLYRLVRLLLILSLASAGPALAQGVSRGGGMSGGGGGSVGLSNKTTKLVVKTLRNGFDVCQKLREVYRYDCYRQTYRLAANQIIENPSYHDAVKALVGVENTLKQIMVKNVDPTIPTNHRRFQTFRAIKPAAIPAAKAQLTQAMEEAETTLLRSSDNAGTHFARIADAIDSNKVLLRSSLLLPLLHALRTIFA